MDANGMPSSPHQGVERTLWMERARDLLMFDRFPPMG
jgi:hypothetical protein